MRKAPSSKGGSGTPGAARTAACRRRQRLGLELLKIEIGGREYDLAIRYVGLKESQTGSKTQVAAAMGRLFGKALLALIIQEEKKM